MDPKTTLNIIEHLGWFMDQGWVAANLNDSSTATCEGTLLWPQIFDAQSCCSVVFERRTAPATAWWCLVTYDGSKGGGEV